MTPEDNHSQDTNFALSQMAEVYIREQKRKRRWGIFFKSVFAGLIVAFLILYSSEDNDSQRRKLKPHAGLININGPIFDSSSSNADSIASSLEKAYKAPGLKGIILRINSPGGSAVQADYIFHEIRRQKKLHPKIKIIAVCSDLCASAAYYIAASADEIYANPNSLVGSIGVVFDGFGFTGAMQKVGVERRLITAGKYKGFMDPYSPAKPEEEKQLQAMLSQVHERFKQQVNKGRGDRLHATEDTYTGLIWTGTEAKTMGLIDHFGSSGTVARKIVGTHDVVDYTYKQNYMDVLAKQFGAGALSEFAKYMGLSQNLTLK